jgi:hypothetical protein
LDQTFPFQGDGGKVGYRRTRDSHQITIRSTSFEADLVAPTIVELSGPRGGVVRHGRRLLEHTAVLIQVATCTRCTSEIDGTPASSHQIRNSSAARA